MPFFRIHLPLVILITQKSIRMKMILLNKEMKCASHRFAAREVFVWKVSVVVGAWAEAGERAAGAPVGQGNAGGQNQWGSVLQVGMARPQTSGWLLGDLINAHSGTFTFFRLKFLFDISKIFDILSSVQYLKWYEFCLLYIDVTILIILHNFTY